MPRIVIMRPGALGDALLALPALAALRAAWPEAHLSFIARGDVLPLVAASRLADSTYPYDLPSWAGLWADASHADPLLHATVAGADALVAWIGDADGTLRRNAAALGVARVIVAPGRPPEDAPEHAALYLLRTLLPLGLRPSATSARELAGHMPPLRPPSSADEAATLRWRELGLAERDVVALHPGSGGMRKCWPPTRFAKLASAASPFGAVPLLLEGPADGSAVRAVLDALPPSLAVPVLRDAPLDVLAAALARCACYVGNDSGVTHLAALLGVPTLALFGPTDPARWSPVGRDVRVLRADDARLAPMSALAVERVESALMRILQATGA